MFLKRVNEKCQNILLIWIIAFLSLPICCRSSTLSSTSSRESHTGIDRTSAIATVHPLASHAAMDALKKGGNAIDAAVAAALTLGVVDSHNSGIGGGCFILIHFSDGSIQAIDGREVASHKATRNMYIQSDPIMPHLSKTGPLAIGIPGSLAAYDYALNKGGKLKLKDLLLKAADLAERGFPIDKKFADRLKNTAEHLKKFKASRDIFVDSAGNPWPKGHILKQPDLGRTYRHIAHEGIAWFYGGPFALALESWMKQNGGIITAADFAQYRCKVRQPVISTYRNYEIIGFGPPSSGGVHVAQILNILENFNLEKLEQEDPALRFHVMAEAMKLAFADRAYWLGDPEFANVPRGLIDKSYARKLAARIHFEQIIDISEYSTPPRADRDFFEKHTTHIAAADKLGNWVAITTTLNTPFGSKVVIPGTGVLMNNQMDDFAISPGIPNSFGLVGAQANSIEPGKRPLSSMSPTIVRKEGKPILTLGAAGGPTIISQVVQVIINYIDLGMPLQNAVAEPRIHHQWRPDELKIESTFDQITTSRLKFMGHNINITSPFGVTQAIGITHDGSLIGVSDPRMP